MTARNPFPLIRSTQERLGRHGQEFLAEFLGRATRRHPDNVAALAELAHVLTRLGRTEEGLEADLKLLELAPDNPTVHYNLACSLSLLGRKDEALDALERSVSLGYDDAAHLVADGDLAALHDEERFRALVRRIELGVD